MRSFFRVELTPPTLHSKRTTNAAKKNREQHERNKEKTFDNHIWAKPDVRGLLYVTFGRVCGYCGANLADNEFVVDHYRPTCAVEGEKNHGGYWWLAYVFENYVLSCSTCNNSSYKGTKFPLLAGNHRTFETKDDEDSEIRALLDPCADTMIDKAFHVDIDSKIVRVHKGSDLEELFKKRVDKSFEVFGEFADTLTIKGRREVRRKVLKSLDEGDIAMARRAASRYSPHSQVARAILARKEDIPIPHPDEEIAWLAEDLIADLGLEKSREQEIPLQKEHAQKKRKELRYALAALLIKPPQGSPETVQRIIEQNGLMGELQQSVEELKRSLKPLPPEPRT